MKLNGDPAQGAYTTDVTKDNLKAELRALECDESVRFFLQKYAQGAL